MKVCRVDNLKNSIEYLKESGLQIIACHEKTTSYHFNADLTKPSAIIMGSEENGISNEYLKRSDMQVKIPMVGIIASLNVSVATGIILSEALSKKVNVLVIKDASVNNEKVKKAKANGITIMTADDLRKQM